MSKLTIVVIDDDKHLVEGIQDYLEAQGFIVHTGDNGASALPLAKARQPSLIILDVDMPYVNGLEALALLRSDPETKQIPVIMLTGVTSASIYPAIQSQPRVSHVKKPADPEDLMSLIHFYLPESNNL